MIAISKRTVPARHALSDDEIAELLHQWDPMCWNIAARWHRANPHASLGDLHAEVVCGFMQAARLFDKRYSNKFSTFAVYWGNNYARQFVHTETARGISIPLRNGIPSASMMADLDAETNFKHPSNPWASYTPEDRPEFPTDFWARIAAVLKDPRGFAFLELKFRHGLTLEQIARRNGLSRERTRQIVSRACWLIGKRWPAAAAYLEGT